MLDYTDIKKIVQETLIEVTRLQEHQVAIVASKHECTIADVKQEVGKLYGFASFAEMFLSHLADKWEESEK